MNLDKEETAMKVRPLHDRILIKRIEEKEAAKAGIIIPDTAREKPMEGEAVAVGPGKQGEGGKREAMDVKTGDRILFGKYAGTEIKIDDQDYVTIRERRSFDVRRKALKPAARKWSPYLICQFENE